MVQGSRLAIRIPCLAACLTTVALLAGCATGFGSPEAVRDHASSLTGVPYVDESGFTVGRSALVMTRMALDALAGGSGSEAVDPD